MGAIRRISLLCAVLSAVLLAGCATPATKGEITPSIAKGGAKEVVLSIVDRRPYILSKEKSEKFEGLMRGGFGIPYTLDRPNRPADDRFVDLLADVIKDGFAEIGTKVVVVKVPIGTSIDDAFKMMSERKGERYLLILVTDSRWDVMFTYHYDFGFDMIVRDPDDKTLTTRNFPGRVTGNASDKFTLWDMVSVIYKEQLEKAFADPTLRTALSN
jgi:hypothetical protein